MTSLHSPQSHLINSAFIEQDADEPSIEQTAQQILASRRITRCDQRLLMQLSTEGALSHHARQLINQVYGGLRQGLIRVVD